MGRAFAAEFLAPVKSVLYMVGSGCDVDEISGSFNVSPQVIDWQLENQDRIRQACADSAARQLGMIGASGGLLGSRWSDSVAFGDEEACAGYQEPGGAGAGPYDCLQRSLLKVNVASNRDFQRHSLLQGEKGRKLARVFFCVERKRNDALSFRDVLEEIYRETGRVEASFSSKWPPRSGARVGRARPGQPWRDHRSWIQDGDWTFVELYAGIRPIDAKCLCDGGGFDSAADGRQEVDLFLWQSRGGRAGPFVPGQDSGSSSTGRGGASGASSPDGVSSPGFAPAARRFGSAASTAPIF